MPRVAWRSSTPYLLSVDTEGAPLRAKEDISVASIGEEVARTYPTSIKVVREHLRGRMAFGVLVAYGLQATWIMLLVSLRQVTVDDSIRMSSSLTGPLVGLLGACFGYFFARDADRHK